MSDTVSGTKTSAVIISLAETAKADNLKSNKYFKCLLEGILEHMDEKTLILLKSFFWGTRISEKY
jgi:hypothetical protein